MTFKTIMAHLEMGRSHAGVLAVATDLAQRLQCEVIGIAACQPMRIDYAAMAYVGDCVQVDLDELKTELRAAEAKFRDALTPHAAALEWRSGITAEPLCDYLSRQARSADLIITHASSADWINNSRRIETGDLIMQVGRPVLVVPDHAHSLETDRVLLAWKDTRETRRAAADALPLLRAASHVVVATVVDEDQMRRSKSDLEDVLAWLKAHGVDAIPVVARAMGDDHGQLQTLAHEQQANLIVAGAYGHSRLQEWALGGMTRQWLHETPICSLLSH
jgi:nucleotide-binding universal stress UspA family protein